MEVNQKQLAVILGITDRRVRQLSNEFGLFQHGQKRKYELEKCVPEYIDYKVKAVEGQTSGESKEKEQAKHEVIKRQISELKLRKLRREMHEAADVEEFLTAMLVSFRATLLAMPSRVSPLIIGESDVNAVTGVLEREVLTVLEQLAEYDPVAIDGDGYDPAMEEDTEEGEDDE